MNNGKCLHWLLKIVMNSTGRQSRTNQTPQKPQDLSGAIQVKPCRLYFLGSTTVPAQADYLTGTPLCQCRVETQPREEQRTAPQHLQKRNFGKAEVNETITRTPPGLTAKPYNILGEGEVMTRTVKNITHRQMRSFRG